MRKKSERATSERRAREQCGRATCKRERERERERSRERVSNLREKFVHGYIL